MTPTLLICRRINTRNACPSMMSAVLCNEKKSNGGVRSRRNGGVRSRRNGGVRSRRNGGVRSRRNGGVRSRRNGGVRSRRNGGVRSRRNILIERIQLGEQFFAETSGIVKSTHQKPSAIVFIKYKVT